MEQIMEQKTLAENEPKANATGLPNWVTPRFAHFTEKQAKKLLEIYTDMNNNIEEAYKNAIDELAGMDYSDSDEDTASASHSAVGGAIYLIEHLLSRGYFQVNESVFDGLMLALKATAYGKKSTFANVYLEKEFHIPDTDGRLFCCTNTGDFEENPGRTVLDYSTVNI